MGCGIGAGHGSGNHGVYERDGGIIGDAGLGEVGECMIHVRGEW